MANTLLHRTIDKLFRTKDGSIVIAQWPNAPIIAFIVGTVGAFLLRDGRLHTGLHSLSQAFLFVWAYLEITSGVNLFRRLLGAVVLAFTIASFFMA